MNFSRKHGMILEAYSPLGVGKIFEVPVGQGAGGEVRQVRRPGLHSLEP